MQYFQFLNHRIISGETQIWFALYTRGREGSPDGPSFLAVNPGQARQLGTFLFEASQGKAPGPMTLHGVGAFHFSSTATSFTVSDQGGQGSTACFDVTEYQDMILLAQISIINLTSGAMDAPPVLSL